MSYTEKYKVDIPPWRSGEWAVKRFEVDEEASKWDQILSITQGTGRFVPPGKYTKLTRGDEVIMSDTPDEIRDHLDPIDQVRRLAKIGEKPVTCLVNGLGLGMVAKAMIDEGAHHVTVIEKSPDVIALVAPHLLKQVSGGEEVRDSYDHPAFKGIRVLNTAAGCMDIVQADAFTVKLPRPSLFLHVPRDTRYDVVWHDIWDNICADNLPEMHRLHRRYGRRCDWQGSWARWHCERQREVVLAWLR